MKDIGIRELKAHASEIVRRVAEERAVYTVTCRGRAVGIICPASPEPAAGTSGVADPWGRLEALADRIGQSRRKRKSALRELAAMRR